METTIIITSGVRVLTAPLTKADINCAVNYAMIGRHRKGPKAMNIESRIHDTLGTLDVDLYTKAVISK